MHDTLAIDPANYTLGDNVAIIHRRADGSIAPIFQENRLCRTLMERGIVSPLWVNAWYAPLIRPFLGRFAEEKTFHNLMTTAGLASIAARINGAAADAAFTYIAVGTGATAANAADTTLQTEPSTSGLSRAAATCTRVTTTGTNDTAQDVVTFTVTGSVAVTESGVLNAASTGTLLCRQVFTAINVANGDSLQVTWKVKAA